MVWGAAVAQRTSDEKISETQKIPGLLFCNFKNVLNVSAKL
jgi:hypothetical protein